jgi:hypothetical protein
MTTEHPFGQTSGRSIARTSTKSPGSRRSWIAPPPAIEHRDAHVPHASRIRFAAPFIFSPLFSSVGENPVARILTIQSGELVSVFTCTMWC